MLRLITTTLLLIFTFSFSTAQDLLVKNNGDTLTISVIEINAKYLIYHNLDVDTLKVFTTPRTKLNRIIYSSGEIYIFYSVKPVIAEATIDDSEKLHFGRGFLAPSISKDGNGLSSKEVVSLYKSIENQKSERLFKKGRLQNIWGNILGLPAGYVLGSEIYKLLDSKRKTNTTALAIGTLGSIISITLNVSGRKKIKKSVTHYNESSYLSLEPTEEGIGLILSF